jgi:peptidoglycan/xylan/chitin deacetylase (PgdA/CDA1 family)
VLPLAEIVGRLTDGKPVPERAVAITFDDGWRDNLEHAFPELESRSLPATVFLPTARIGSEDAFWPEQVCRRMQPLSQSERRELAGSLGAQGSKSPVQDILELFKCLPEEDRIRRHTDLISRTPDVPSPGREILSWEEVERAATLGIEFESHGATHAILTRLDPQAAERDLGGSLAMLRERGLGRHSYLAYPSGGYDSRISTLARTAGYRAAFTTERGLIDGLRPQMALPRLGLHDDISRHRAEFRRCVPGRPTRIPEAASFARKSLAP